MKKQKLVEMLSKALLAANYVGDAPKFKECCMEQGIDSQRVMSLFELACDLEHASCGEEHGIGSFDAEAAAETCKRIRLDNMGLANRTMNAVARYCFMSKLPESFYTVLLLPEKQIYAIRNIGPACVQELKARLEDVAYGEFHMSAGELRDILLSSKTCTSQTPEECLEECRNIKLENVGIGGAYYAAILRERESVLSHCKVFTLYDLITMLQSDRKHYGLQRVRGIGPDAFQKIRATVDGFVKAKFHTGLDELMAALHDIQA